MTQQRRDRERYIELYRKVQTEYVIADEKAAVTVAEMNEYGHLEDDLATLP